jgi:hypothetical protein
MILESIVLFLLDLSMFILFKKWIVFSLLSYLIFLILNDNSLDQPFTFNLFYFPLTLFLLQDNFINGKFGLSLIYLIPIWLLSLNIKKFFDPKMTFFYCFFMVLAVFIQNVFIKYLLLSQNIGFYSTLSKIFINIVVTYLVLLGMRGNRSLPDFSG